MSTAHYTKRVPSMMDHTLDREEIDTLALFDDRLVADLAGMDHRPLSDGVDNDNPYRALPVERWSRMAGWRYRA